MIQKDNNNNNNWPLQFEEKLIGVQLQNKKRRPLASSRRRPSSKGKPTEASLPPDQRDDHGVRASSRPRDGFLVAQGVDGVGRIVVAPGRAGRRNEAPRQHRRESPRSKVINGASLAYFPPPLAVLRPAAVGRVRPRPRLRDVEDLAVTFRNDGRWSNSRGWRGREEKEEDKRGQKCKTLAETHQSWVSWDWRAICQECKKKKKKKIRVVM